MHEETYQKLAEFLDRLPGGFAPCDDGAHLRLLRELFNPEDAELVIHLTIDREDARTIAGRAGLPAAEAEMRLEKLAKKGLIFSFSPENGPALYHAVPFVVGIYEFQANRLNPKLLLALRNWTHTREKRPLPEVTGQIRTIPIGKSIPTHLEVLPWERTDELIKSHDRFAVAPCICRRLARMVLRGCKAPEESCLMFGDMADFYVRTGRGRYVSRSELGEILKKADAANLVLQPSNAKNIEFICCCCGCCCGVLRAMQKHPHPAEIACSGFIARFNEEACRGCRTCIKRCQMQAFAVDGDRVSFNPERCIGCGLCVSTCPGKALTLERRPGVEIISVPADTNEAWHRMAG